MGENPILHIIGRRLIAMGSTKKMSIIFRKKMITFTIDVRRMIEAREEHRKKVLKNKGPHISHSNLLSLNILESLLGVVIT